MKKDAVKKIAVLGSTGSIGTSALRVIQKHFKAFRVVALAARGGRVERLEAQVRAFRPKIVSVFDSTRAQVLRRRLEGLPLRVLSGEEGLRAAVLESGADFVLSAIVGAAGLSPTLAALEAGLTVGVANKEPLVMAGDLLTKAARRSGAVILPVDSEHSAVFQCLRAGTFHGNGEVHRIWLTASGGPFRRWSREKIRRAGVKEALRHPTWRMGPKITVDSATLMNKGLEVLEAHHLFQMPFEKIEVVIHPQSIVHSLVEFVDGSLLAHLGVTDMRIPIQYAFSYPRRLETPVQRLDLYRLSGLNFEKPDRKNFPALGLAYTAGRMGGTAPAVLNAANEEAVSGFLRGRLSFWRIPWLVEKVLARHRRRPADSLGEVLEADAWARKVALELVP